MIPDRLEELRRQLENIESDLARATRAGNIHEIAVINSELTDWWLENEQEFVELGGEP